MNYRWQAAVSYHTNAGINVVTHDLSELADLHDLVEQGPHWHTLAQMVVVRVNHIDSEQLTVEQAEQMTIDRAR